MNSKSRLFASAAFPLLSLSLIITPSHALAFSSVENKTNPVYAAAAFDGSYQVAQAAEGDEEQLKKKPKGEGAGGGESGQPSAEPGREPAQGGKKRQQAEGAEGGAPRGEPAEKPRRQAAEPDAEGAGEPAGRPSRAKAANSEQPATAEPQAEQPKPGKARPSRQNATEEASPGDEPAAPKPGSKRQTPAQQSTDDGAQPPQTQPGRASKPAPAKPGASTEEPQSNKAAEPKAATEQPAGTETAPRKRPTAGTAEQPEQPEGKPNAAPKSQQATPTEETPRTPGTTGTRRAQPQTETQPQTQTAPSTAAPGAPAAQSPAETGTQPTGQAPTTQEPATQAPVTQEGTGQRPGTQPGANETQPQLRTAPATAPADQQQVPAGQDAANQRVLPPPEKVTKQELEQRRQIAQDPSKATNQTVILPVENGAPVLDSAKRSYRMRGDGTQPPREQTNIQINNNYVAPRSDQDSQRGPRGRDLPPPMDFQALSRERGERLDDRPRFARPDGARIDEGPSRDDGGRVVIQFGDNVVVRHDDDARFIQDGERPTYDRLSGDRYREVIDRPDGWRIVTVRNRYGDIIQRSRVDSRGREYVIFYAPELAENPDRDYFRDPGEDLPPMRLRIPLDDYIVDTSSQPDRDYYDFLREPPVEPVERVYSLNEVRYSARLRDKVRRIDLDTLTFATGSWEIPMNEASTLRRVADAINELLKKNPSESFLIEGHTDAVGTPESNLVLSDRRAESVARVLTDAYGIPAENMATQGYGEQFLKVNTPGPNQENRRVTIRRITPLVRPVASNQ